MKTPPMSPERENLPLVKISRALDRVVDRIKERELPDAEDMIIAADWIDRQRMSNLKRGLFEGCDECGARVTKYGCPNCMRIALTMCEQWTKRDIDIYETHTPPVEMMNALKHRLAEIQKALNAGSPNAAGEQPAPERKHEK